MKTSNKLLIAAAVIIIGCCVAFDFSLKAEYTKGDYKKRFYEMKSIPLSGFNAIRNNAANSTTLNIEQGPRFEIWVNDEAMEGLVISKTGRTLNIDYKNSEANKGSRYYGVTIICPTLESVRTGYKSLTALSDRGGTTTIEGFNEDKMDLQVNNSTMIALTNNNIGDFGAIVNSGLLTLTQANKVGNGNFDIKDDGRLTLLDPDIEKFNYHFADGSTISLSGKVLKMVSH